MNAAGHWFWWILTGLCLTWYSTITLYVAVKGAMDIRNMLRRLDANDMENPADEKCQVTSLENGRPVPR